MGVLTSSPGRDPSLWWLNWELPEYSHASVLSVTRVRDFWILVTDRNIWKLSDDHEGRPVAQLVQELF